MSTPQCLPRAQVASSQQSAVIIPYKQCRHSQPHQPTLPCWSQHVAAKTSGLGENRFKWNYNNKELIRVFACLWLPHSEHFSGAPRNLVSLHLSSHISTFSLKSYIWKNCYLKAAGAPLAANQCRVWRLISPSAVNSRRTEPGHGENQFMYLGPPGPVLVLVLECCRDLYLQHFAE